MNFPISNEIVVYVNFNLPSTVKRLYVVQKGKVLFSTYVAHGTNSGSGEYATKFSNEDGTHMSCLGHFKCLNTYVGKHGLSRRIEGLDSTNNNTLARDIVIHAAPYIGDGKAGHSWGCFAVPVNDISTILKYTQPGTILISYYG